MFNNKPNEFNKRIFILKYKNTTPLSVDVKSCYDTLK